MKRARRHCAALIFAVATLMLAVAASQAEDRQKAVTAAPMCVQTPGISGACSVVHYFDSSESDASDFLSDNPMDTVSPVLAQTERKPVEPERPPLEEMAGQMLMIGFRGTGEDAEADDLPFILEDIATGRIGGVIFFERDHVTGISGRNIRSLEQVKHLSNILQAHAPFPLFIGVDQEGGRVRRLREEHGVPRTPSAYEMGMGAPELTFDEAYQLGQMLQTAGINLNFAPSLDVDINPESPAIGAMGRSFSDNHVQVTLHGLAFAKGLSQAGIIPCYKHFPGHGSAADDTHLGMADISDTWLDLELEPYRVILPQSPAAMVMPGHMVHKGLDENLPSSLSARTVGGVLRNDLGWRGVVISDDLQMQAIGKHYSRKEAIRLAVEAGVDILLFGNNLEHDPNLGAHTHALLMELIYEGAITPQRVWESYERIMALKKAIATSRPK